MSTFGPLQKLSFTLFASGALMRTCTRPVASMRGYSAPHTFVSAGWNWAASWANETPAVTSRASAIVLMNFPWSIDYEFRERGCRARGTCAAASWLHPPRVGCADQYVLRKWHFVRP